MWLLGEKLWLWNSKAGIQLAKSEIGWAYCPLDKFAAG
jgi:hypothetical protein